MKTLVQDPKDLVLGVFRTPSLTKVEELKEAGFQYGFIHGICTIIGESHRIQIYRHNELLVEEILACIPLACETSVHRHCFSNGQDHSWGITGYAINVSFIQTHDIPKPIHLSSIQLDFPETFGRIPVTRISWQRISYTGISWWTVHTYPSPSGLTVVQTESVLDTLAFR